MTAQEMRELDAWIAEYVMGFRKCPMPDETGWIDDSKSTNPYFPCFQPTTDPAAAMSVLERCLEKHGYGITIDVHDDAGFSLVGNSPYVATNPDVGDETLPLTICLFAKKLFSK